MAGRVRNGKNLFPSQSFQDTRLVYKVSRNLILSIRQRESRFEVAVCYNFSLPPPCLSSFATSVSSICSWPLKPESNEDTFYASKVGARRKEGRGKNFVPASVVKNFPTQIYWPPPIPFIAMVCFYLYARIGEDYLSFKGLRISPLHSQIPSVCFLSTINFWKEKNFLVVLLQRTKFEIDLE